MYSPSAGERPILMILPSLTAITLEPGLASITAPRLLSESTVSARLVPRSASLITFAADSSA
jgi:hypothetical protein